MPNIKITDRLSKGETLLLDGGTGSELQRRGANVLKGATSKLIAWSATTNIEFSLPNDSYVTIKIYKLIGKEISP